MRPFSQSVPLLSSSDLQFLMDEQLEAIYKQFNCYESILTERKAREAASEDHRGYSRSIFCLNEDYNNRSILVERYNSTSNTFEDVRTINVDGLICYEVQLHENKVYVIGGHHNKVESSVSISMYSIDCSLLPIITWTVPLDDGRSP